MSWIIVGVVLLVASCSDSSSTGSDPTEAGLVGRVEANAEALINSQPKASYDFLSDRCRDEVTFDDYAAQFAIGAALLEGFLDTSLDELNLRDVEVVEFEEGGTAEVTAVMEIDGVPDADMESEPQPWVYEDGWNLDDCSEFGGSASDDGAGADPATVDADDLRPANEARFENLIDAAEGPLDPGATADLEGIFVTVSAMEVNDEGNLSLLIRSENRTTEDSSNPEIELLCTNNLDGGWIQSSGTTWENFVDLPGGTFDEGLVALGLPQDFDTGEVADCEAPAYVRVHPAMTINDQPAAIWAVPSELVAEMEAASS